MSIVGNDVDEEVVSRDVPVSTPVMKAKPLRVPLRERTNKTPGNAVKGKRSKAKDADSATNATTATPTPMKQVERTPTPEKQLERGPEPAKPAEREEEEVSEAEEEASEEASDAPESEQALAAPANENVETDAMVCDDSKEESEQDRTFEFANEANVAADEENTQTEMDSTSAQNNKGLALLRQGLRAMRDGGIDPSECLISLCVNPQKPNAREAATTVVNRLVAGIDEMSESPEKEQVSTSVIPEEQLDEEDEDVFATAPPSPIGSVESIEGNRGANPNAVALALSSIQLERQTSMETYTVEEGVMGCGDVGCTPGGGTCGDPVACLTKRFKEVGGPFKLPLDRQASTVSTAVSSPSPVVEPLEEDQSDEESDEADAESSDSEADAESVAGTEDDGSGDEEEEESKSEYECDSVAETASVVGTVDNGDEDFACEDSAAVQEAEAEETLVASPGPEVVDVAELPGGTPIASSPCPPSEVCEVEQKQKESSQDSSSDEEQGPVSVRKRGGRRVVLSDESSDDEDQDTESSGESPDAAPRDSTPPAASVSPLRETTPVQESPERSAVPAFTPAPPTTGKKKSMLRIKSAAKLARKPKRPDFDFANDDDDASDANPAHSNASDATATAPAVLLARTTSFPKSALKKSKPAEVEEESEQSPSPARPRRRVASKNAAVASARRQALTWLDHEASVDGNDSDEEASEGNPSDDDFVCSDDDVEYASDASSGDIANDVLARSGGMMPNVDKPLRVPKSVKKTPGRGVTFFSPEDAGAIELSSDEEEENGQSPETKKPAADPYCPLDGLHTPTPPKALTNSTPYNPKTPKSAIGRKPGGGEYAGYGEAPPTHSKALAAALASAAKPGKSLNFARHKETIAAALYSEFNKDGFDGALPDTFEITWNAKLLTTAGLTHYRKITRSSGKSEYHARIELSTKVLDTAEKLEATLLHEMCHAAAWLLDQCAKPPHGSVFKKWATKVMRVYPVVSVDTCHSYQIHQPFKYRCTQTWCLQEYGRHSKSIDVTQKACGVCHGRLEFLGKFNADGSMAVEKKATAFSLFVKEHFGAVKEKLPAGTPHRGIMKELSVQWKSTGGTGRKTRGGDVEDDDALGEGMRTLKL